MHEDRLWFQGAVQTRYINNDCSIGKIVLDSLTGDQKDRLRMVLRKLYDFGVGIGIQPHPSEPSSNIEIVRPNDGRIDQRIWLKGDRLATLWRGNKYHADGIILDHYARERKMGYIIFTAGAPTVLIYSKEFDMLLIVRILFQHLLEPSGIIEKAIDQFPKRVVSRLQAAICLGQRNYLLKKDHPDTEKNLELIRENWPSALKNNNEKETSVILPTLIELHLRNYGVRGEISNDNIDTAIDEVLDGGKWHSGPDGGRNAVIVKLV